MEDITEALWGSKVSPATISELNKKTYVHIEDWRNRPLQGGRYPYVYVDGIYLRRNWGGEYENMAILVAIAVNEDGFREVLDAAEGMKEDKASWVSFFQLTYCNFPSEHWTRIRTNNVIERLNREIRRRTRVVETFPDGNSALMLVCARLRHVTGTQWGQQEIHEYEASGGGSGRRRCCRLTSFSRSLQINLRINLDGTDGTNSGRICGYISVFPHLSGHCSGRDRS